MRIRNTTHELGQYAHDLICSKARCLVGTAGFTLDDCDDIEQELALDLLGRGHKNWRLEPVGAHETGYGPVRRSQNGLWTCLGARYCRVRDRTSVVVEGTIRDT